MTDPHQVNSLIASAIFECRKHHDGEAIDPEEAKTMAKCIIQQLSDAGLMVVPDPDRNKRLSPASDRGIDAGR
jgi:hypothetical protein